MTLFGVLLTIHITAGATALLSGLGASMVKQLNWPHAWHKRFGNSFFLGMLVIFITALPMSLIVNNLFLLFIALFSFYFAYTGWRYAKNRTGKPEKEDWLAVIFMLTVCSAMLMYGLYLLFNSNDKNAITLLIFAVIGIVNAVRNAYNLKAGGLTGSTRIALHATMMLAGSIATVTAFLVANFSTDPEYILWLAPTIFITPYIIYWNIRIRRKASTATVRQ